MSVDSTSLSNGSPNRSGRSLEAFLALISSLSGRLAGAAGDAVDREIEAGLHELLTFFGVEQCGILEFESVGRKARLRHFAKLDGVTPVPDTLDYGTALPWSHERAMQGKAFVQTCIDDLPVEAAIDRAAATALGLQTIVSIPVGIGRRITHVLALASSKSVRDWPEPILAWLRMIAETFLAARTRRNVEVALAHSERTLAQAQHVAEVGSYVCDWSIGTLAVSDEAARILGGALGDNPTEFLDRVHPGDRMQVNEALENMLSKAAATVDLEYRIVRPDGNVRTVRSRAETTYAMDGKPERTLGTIQDISHLRATEDESRRLRAQLRHADRAAHLGALTASLSHEITQPLTGILANSQAGLRLLAKPRTDLSEMRDIFESIIRDDKRATSVITNLRLLLRREEAAREPVDIGDAIAEVLALFKGEFEANDLQLTAQIEHGCRVVAVKTQLQQVMVNLLSNAIHALRAGAEASDRMLEVRLVRSGNGQAQISVRDNGPGIAPDAMPRIFEPFFSTKTDGLGMGLAITRSIIEAHGGEIGAETQPSGGTAFHVRIPVESVEDFTSAFAVATTAVPRNVSSSGADVTVCVVDDDPAIRESLARLLVAAGLQVVAFESGAVALESPDLARAHCLVLDVQMPGISGPEMQAELARRGIAAPVVFLTARTDAPTGVLAMKQGALEYLCKPVEDAALLAAVHTAIERYATQARANRERADIEGRLTRLTARERDVLREVIAGRLNKQIADRLAISEATVKQHRGQVMDKLQARSVAELVRLCQIAGFPARS